MILRNLTLARRVQLLVLGTMAAGLTVAGIILGVLDRQEFRRALVNEMQAEASVVAANTVAALAFDDVEHAAQILASFSTSERVTSACLWTADGERFACHGVAEQWESASVLPERWEFTDTALDVVAPVMLEDRRIGTLSVRNNLDQLARRAWEHVLTLVGVLLFSLLMVALLVQPLQRMTWQPIAVLARTAREVTTLHDYSLRAAQSGTGEIANLTADFNGMLAAMEESRSRLERHGAELEEQVNARTLQLLNLNAELVGALDRAESANRMKTQFLANVSHEIRTPMNGIIGMTDLLLESSLEGQEREYLEAVRSSADTLMVLINDLLDVSRLESGRMEKHEVPFSLRTMVHDLMVPFEVRARAKGLALTARVDEAVPDALFGDDIKLRQVLVNLLGNALKFTQSGSIDVGVGVEAASDDSVILKATVRDTGIGIPAAKHRLIFDEFVQADGSTTRSHGGTGLGLAICQKLLALLGGTISVKSHVGLGSAFTFTVPLRIAQETADILTESPQRKGAAHFPGRPRILVAEDNDVNRLLVRRLLETAGCEVTVAVDGLAALSALERERFDAALVDVQMPFMSGLDLARTWRAREPRETWLPMIACTAHARPEDELACTEAGMDAYVTKPIEKEALLSALAGLLGPHVDKASLRERAGGDEGIVSDVLAALRESLSPSWQELEARQAAGDLVGVADLAHGLVGALATAGARRGAALARSLERAARQGENTRAHAESLRRECRMIQAELGPNSEMKVSA